jgi:NRPS condensation-like uncharacterized protein
LGLYIATITTLHLIPADPDFWQLASNVKAQLTEVLTSGDANLIHMIYPQGSLIRTTRHSARLVQSAVAMAPPSSMLTNIGRMDGITLLNGARVRSVEFMVSPPPQHPICVTVTSYADSLYLNLLYDQTKMDTTQARRMGNTFIAFLQTAAET